jgi:hypothetical protein
LAVSLVAIGSLIAGTVRSVRSFDRRIALVETTRAVVAGLPDRDRLGPGNFSGVMAGHHWRVAVSPLVIEDVDPTSSSTWSPYAVAVRVQGASGAVLQVNTVRLRRNVAP